MPPLNTFYHSFHQSGQLIGYPFLMGVNEESVIQTQKSGFKAATIRVKSAHWGGDWNFFFGD